MKRCRNEFFEAQNDGIHCLICPNACVITPGRRGRCRAFEADADGLLSTIHGKASSLAVDPIEKKPLNHFLPGSSVLSMGTIGCNLSCSFCQNWDISMAKERESHCREVSPQSLVSVAKSQGCESVAFTYNEPTIFIDFVLDAATAIHEAGLKTVAVTNGFIHGKARELLYDSMDAANVDLKSFSDDFYKRLCNARRDPVLETLKHIRRNTNCWLEITTLLIPGENDSKDERDALFGWILNELGNDVPLHLSAFHPQYHMTDKPSTPTSTVVEARDQAMKKGLRFVYTGNVYCPQGEVTHCPSCNEVVIERNRYTTAVTGLTGNACSSCGTMIAGVFQEI
jgi:pyruvate formate lyase activating enzyme